MIYLDHNATTPIDSRVLDAMLPYLSTHYGNPSGLYRAGRLARSAIDTARRQIAELVGVRSERIIFTSGGTEANNLALASLRGKASLAVSAIEHPSVLEPANRLRLNGHTVTTIGVNGQGLIERGSVEEIVSQNKPALASIMLANNETGAIQNIAEFTEILHANNALVHTDAVQAVGKIAVDFAALGVDLMSLSSHKIYGPKGVGALVVGNNVVLNPILLGGGQEDGYRAGTENVAAIVGFGKAAELAELELGQRTHHLKRLRDLLEHGLRAIPGLHIFAENAQRLPNTLQFGMPECDGEMMLMALDRLGVATSSGSACSVGGKEPSHVLTAMGVDDTLARSALRVSLGINNTEDEISQFLYHLKNLVCQEG